MTEFLSAYAGIAGMWGLGFYMAIRPRSKGEWLGFALCIAFWPLLLLWIFAAEGKDCR